MASPVARERGASRRRRSCAASPAAAVCAAALALGCGETQPLLPAPPVWLAAEHLAEAQQEVPGAIPAQLGHAELLGDMRPRLFQHAPSSLVFPAIRIDEGDRLALAFGIDDGAWGPDATGDGAAFRASLRLDDGTSAVLLERRLEPRTRAADRGWQDAWVDLTPHAGQLGRLVLETMPGPTATQDWTSWSEPRIVHLGSGHGSRPQPNLLLVSFDTLRADFVTAYGGPPNASPRIDALAARGARFSRATAVAPWTLPSHFSMLTGRYPDQKLFTYDGHPCAISLDEVTLAERMSDAGYHTAAFTGGGFVGAPLGFGQGFHEFRTRGRRFEANLPAIETWIERYGAEPFFLFVHHFNMHREYAPPSGVLERFADATPDACRGVTFSNDDMRNGRRDRCIRAPGGRRYLQAVYAAELAYADELLGRVLRALETAGALDDTVVVVTSDHGEELLDHGSFDHVRTLYREVLDVPLVIAGPGVAQGIVVPDLADSTDLVPTLLDVLGLPRAAATDAPLDGRSHARALSPLGAWWPRRPPREVAFAATGLELSLPEMHEERYAWKSAGIGEDRKLVEMRGDGDRVRTLFDLDEDPLEMHPEVPQGDTRTRGLGEALAHWQQDVAAARRCVPEPIGDDVREQLRALGYGE